ncbi:MAG TPA: hypothetical protein VFG85_01585 [Gaiellaceae bacterium]|nr:hypothetical protein [Gaiellaceae bacterium]
MSCGWRVQIPGAAIAGKDRPRSDTNINVGTVLRADREERAAVAAWRRHQLDEAGFPASLAASLADDPRVDVHALIELVERGCRPELAARIAMPLEVDPLS